MEKLLNIPILEKNVLKIVKSVDSTSCCTPRIEAASCCTPSKTNKENEGACCAQPKDGTACCNK